MTKREQWRHWASAALKSQSVAHLAMVSAAQGRSLEEVQVAHASRVADLMLRTEQDRFPGALSKAAHRLKPKEKRGEKRHG